MKKKWNCPAGALVLVLVWSFVQEAVKGAQNDTLLPTSALEQAYQRGYLDGTNKQQGPTPTGKKSLKDLKLEAKKAYLRERGTTLKKNRNTGYWGYGYGYGSEYVYWLDKHDPATAKRYLNAYNSYSYQLQKEYGYESNQQKDLEDGWEAGWGE